MADHIIRYAGFRCDKLAYLPRIGENITVPFLKAEIGSDYFYAQDIKCHFDSATNIIDIDLKAVISIVFGIIESMKRFNRARLL